MGFIKDVIWGETVKDWKQGRILTSIPVLFVLAILAGGFAMWLNECQLCTCDNDEQLLRIPRDYKNSVSNMWIYDADDGGEFIVEYNKK